MKPEPISDDLDLTIYDALEVAQILKSPITRVEGLFRSNAISTFRVGASRRCTKRALLEFIRAGGGSDPMPAKVKLELSMRHRSTQAAKNARA